MAIKIVILIRFQNLFVKFSKNFQEGKEQALYFDAHVLDAQRRRHDVRGCRCRFLVRYDHDQSEVYYCTYFPNMGFLSLKSRLFQ